MDVSLARMERCVELDLNVRNVRTAQEILNLRGEFPVSGLKNLAKLVASSKPILSATRLIAKSVRTSIVSVHQGRKVLANQSRPHMIHTMRSHELCHVY